MAGKTFHGRWAAVQATALASSSQPSPAPSRDAAVGAAPMRSWHCSAKRPVYPRCQALFWHVRTPARSNKRLSRSVPGEVNHATHPQVFRHRGSRRRSAAAIAASAFAAEYSMTVNRDRLINAQNEPQNWLMMNGDYGSMRYSKLTELIATT